MMKTLFVIFCMEQLLLIQCKWCEWTQASWWWILLPVEVVGILIVLCIVIAVIDRFFNYH
jgi:hypothetical protein